MSKNLIPEHVKLAAKRGFLRTASQSLATSFSVSAGLTIAFTSDALLALGVGVASMIGTAVVNGAQSYFSILAKGIPEEYQGDLVEE